MKGSFRRRNCTCGKKRCTCGALVYYRYDITDPATGKRKQKEAGGFRSMKEAREAATQIQAELQSGTYIEEKETTFERFAQDWLASYKNTGKVKISTVRVRKHEIGRLEDYFKKLKIKDITSKQYQDALNDLKEKGYADNTVDGVHRTGRMIFKRAVQLKITKEDPTEYAIVPKTMATVDDLEQETEIPGYLEKEELALFLQTAKEHGFDRDYVIFTVLAYTGIRVGELCALKWSDVSFKDQTISITKTYYNPKNNIQKYSLLTPKTKRSIRVIDVEGEVITALKNHLTYQNKVKMRHRDIYYDKNFVFAQTNRYPGYPPYIKLIESRMARLLKLAGLDQSLTPHSLRHTHTSLLAEAGVSLEQIMHRLGHADDATTKNIYLHITKPKRKEASQKFSELMRSF